MNQHKDHVNPQPDTSDISLRPRLMAEAEKRLSKIDEEVANGYDIIKKCDKTVTFFGSARFKETHPYYASARNLAGLLAKDGYTIVTGGGGGIMQAGNHGAHDVKADSVGLNIQLPNEQVLNPYVTKHASFRYFFTRKVMLAFFADAYIYFPGGYGTLDEFFEVLTLMQTHKMPRVPMILVGNEYWRSLDMFIRSHLLNSTHAITVGDEKIYTITEDFEQIRTIIADHRKLMVS